MKPIRIGIVGGMGPLAGVYLQRLIIEATAATRDQDHIQVVCFTNPEIPDRTASLNYDGGDAYVEAIADSIRSLERAGATHVVVACNTAHARFLDIARSTVLPVLDLVRITVENTASVLPQSSNIALLATDGTIATEVYQRSGAGGDAVWVLPDAEEQQEVMKMIYAIKAGEYAGAEERLGGLIDAMKAKGAQAIILGCTELSLYFEALTAQRDIIIVDPLRVMASHLVRLAGKESFRPILRPVDTVY